MKRSWVWVSSAQSVADGTLSVLAVAETLLASALGAWIWLRWGLYPLLLSSLVMAFLTMLRSDESVKLGSAWFQAYYKAHEIPLKRRRGAAIVGLSALMTASVAYWLAVIWLAPHSGWSLFWRAGVIGLISINISVAVAVAVAGAVAVVGAGAGAVAVAVAVVVVGVGVGVGVGVVVVAVAVAGAGAGALAGVILICPGIATGIFLRAVFVRALATLRHVIGGVLRFPANWSALVTSVDILTEPELVPGLPEDSGFRFGPILAQSKTGNMIGRVLSATVILFGFLPTWLFRLTLKSTFFVYWPLLFIASAPKSRKTDTGSLIWDDSFGRAVMDWLAALIAVAVLFRIGWTIYDPSFYASFIQWADPRGLPSYVLLRAFGFKVWQLDIWEWCALIASAITVITFIWANAINVRLVPKGRQPGWGQQKAIYALNRVKGLCVIATILASLFAMVWFVHDTCTLPVWMRELLTYVFGALSDCVGQPL